ncbi:hypothetical protein GSY74_06630 [Sulfurovum sp. bin170]|uniref:hypothetical protein n=1 Tax=Sulfurovum sp. bin170 TaxID=2695268 RepID=UPI0013DEE462|nr:hypothetical protein [Sulfurovum sp. bin170]NEW60956.1 hypothetical protein [Sulfurovum sp. bin170]
MKKIIGLSLLTILLMAQESVTNLKLEQVNKIIDSTFHEEGIKSQGTVDIEDDAFVDNVHIVQKPSGIEEQPGNLIIDSTVTSAGTQIHQGLTHVKSGAKLQDAKLVSENEINNLTATGGESFVTQGNLIVGEESNVTNIIDNSGGNSVGDGTADKFTITETNKIKDTNIKNSIIHQGLITITDGASVSQLEIEQKNSVKRTDSSGSNDINSSTITQGLIKAKGSMLNSIRQNIDNEIDNLKIDNSHIEQSSIISTDSDINSLNHKLNGFNTSERIRNEITNTDMEDATISQSTLKVESSEVDELNNYDRGSLQKSNLIHTATIENNATLSQSTIVVRDSSRLINVELKTKEGSSQEAMNEAKNVDVSDNSAIYQDRLELESATVEDSTFSRANTLNYVQVEDGSTLYQFYTHVVGANMDGAKLADKSSITDTSINNSAVAQSLTTVMD